MILVVAEQREGKLNRASWEAIAAAQQAGDRQGRASLGSGVDALAGELAAAEAAEVIAVDADGARATTPRTATSLALQRADRGGAAVARVLRRTPTRRATSRRRWRRGSAAR